jgi:hypothetical protein
MKEFGNNRPEKQSRVRLEEPEIALIKEIAEKAQLSVADIHELTGMPKGSIDGFCRTHGITLPEKPKGGPSRKHNILVARNKAVVQRRHAEALARIREKYSKEK